MSALRCIVLSITFAMTSLVYGSEITAFWEWFSLNEVRLFAVNASSETLFDELAAEMHKIQPDLTFEFGPVVDGKREFVISADGLRAAFPSVEAIHAAAPALPRWIWVKFRPRRTAMDVAIGEISVPASTVKAFVTKSSESGRLNVYLIIPGYTPANDDVYRMIAYLILDQALGEYDTETKVGGIEILSAAPKNRMFIWSLESFPQAFDTLHKQMASGTN